MNAVVPITVPITVNDTHKPLTAAGGFYRFASTQRIARKL